METSRIINLEVRKLLSRRSQYHSPNKCDGIVNFTAAGKTMAIVWVKMTMRNFFSEGL